ncbi:MAG: RNA polymerase sigma factor [Acidobacteria bacterium]|nr:RNA polymerase sigma factor [Acidobacteriota bacterium]
MTDPLARLRRREPATLHEIVHQNTRRLFRAAQGMGFSSAEADDLVQDVFVTFLETLDRFEGRSQVSTWLFGILHHKVQERRRSRARDDLHDPVDELFESKFDAKGKWIAPLPSPDRVASSAQAAGAIADCLQGLPPLHREVFHLREVEELSAADVSNIIGRTVTHVGVLFHRARLRLRECLDGKGWSPPR